MPRFRFRLRSLVLAILAAALILAVALRPSVLAIGLLYYGAVAAVLLAIVRS